MYFYIMSKYAYITYLCFATFFFANTLLFAQNNLTKNETTLIQPKYLKAGDSVAIVAPSGILKNRQAEVKRAVALLKSWGLHAVVGKHVFNQTNHFAGTDDERCEDLQEALDNPSIRAIWCARGGYGTVRILDRLDYTKFKENPKWVIGYSDITALHNQIHNMGFETIPVPIIMRAKSPVSMASFINWSNSDFNSCGKSCILLYLDKAVIALF